jgi:cyanophycin synthetase
MKIVDVHFLAGRNIYSHRSVMRVLLNLQQWRTYQSDSVLCNQLLLTLPGLTEHYCSRRRHGGFVERLKEGTYAGHIVEHVFLELQSLSGMETEYGKTMNRNDGLTEVICEYRCREAALFLARIAVDLVMAALRGEIFEPKPFIAEARELASRHLPGPSTAAILAAARRRQIPVEPLEPGNSLYRLGTGKHQKRIMASVSEVTGCIATDIACNKPLSKIILEQEGLPIPVGLVARSPQEAQQAAKKIGFPLAVKPDNGNQGKGVSLQVRTPADLIKAFHVAAAYSPAVLVEKYLSGRHYRLLVVGRTMVAAALRIPAHVTGDGLHSIGQLIERENQNPLRGDGHDKPLTKIIVDNAVESVVAKQGLNLSSVPFRDQQVWLRENDNLSTGGTAIDVTDRVHPLQAELAVRAVRAIGLDIGGVDVVMADISTPPAGQCGAIIEVNAAPGLRMHLFPSKGEKRDVGQHIVDFLFPSGTPSRIPVFSVTGTNGKTTTARLLDFAMRRHGLESGLCCTDGIYHNGNLVRKGDMTGPAGAKAVLGNRDIDVAVLETARGGIVRRGLGYDRADVAVICNIREDHLGQDGIETMDDLVHAKSLIAEAVYASGSVVLNADDYYVNEITVTCWSEVIYFSMQDGNIAVCRHLGKGGRAVFVRRGMILAAQGSRTIPVGRVREFAVTLGGRASHQTENLLAAIAACWGYGLSPRQAGLYLRSFAASFSDNPGRANLYQVGNFRVLVDYGHNADGIGKIGMLARKLKFNRLIGVMGVPGDRSDELIVSAGRTAAGYFERLIIKEDDDLRGRKSGDVAKLLLHGATEAGLAADKITLEHDERTAVQSALAMARDGDLVVVFYEKLDSVLGEILKRHSAECPFGNHENVSSNRLGTSVMLP